jgi:NADPH:quinone reductase-like Zn-dependent oxidoreductase
MERNLMKAIPYTRHGPPDILKLKEVEKPTPTDSAALVRVCAASVNAADVEFLRGVFWSRIYELQIPKPKILGSDISGRVEAVGRNVKQFQRGDEVWGDLSLYGYGTFAEYVCIPEEALRLKPASMTYEEAAAVPTAGVVALQNLRGKRPIEPGQTVLINGAGGGVGTFAVQLAKHFGAEVTGVDSTMKLDMLRSIGADHVIDYTKADFSKSGQRYDLILDVVAHRSILAYRRALGPKGIYVFVGGSTSAIFQALFLGPLISKIGSKKMGVVMWKPNNKEDLAFLEELLEAGQVVPVIDRRYPLSEVPEALRYLEGGHVLGKVVITVEHSGNS